ncbi:DUF5313 family protein [Pseudofrankia asymbiotica]|uniref:DUF5313 domain-containing protein n=1 Tax=Pseudofrankia asymbiotica TaxID=1834516 RepID=A0A1V2IGW2_9ACTN|nr:DUF5313 family protein [Pseudofrankia asymbiotica]ONH32285.1 hypothetical protein BL253_06115 [Pseudofrankia asymbiotica]
MDVGNEARTGTAEAERPVGAASAPVGGLKAPPLTGRVAYVFGVALPAQYGAWVSRDLTGPGWRRRQALRPVLMMLPFAVVFALLPGPVGTRAVLVGFLLVAAGALGLGLSGHFRNRRLVQHGFPPVIKPNAEDVEDEEPVPAARPGGRTGGTPSRSTTPSVDPEDDPDGVNA